jgi:cell division septum initiation protein DivIVA
MPEKITELTAEAIRKSGLETAENIRSYAKKVREESESMAKYADEVANAVITASSHAADRIAGYLQRCEDARAAFQQHEALLTSLPEVEEKPEKEKPEKEPAGRPTAAIPFNMADLERSLDAMAHPDPRPPR